MTWERGGILRRVTEKAKISFAPSGGAGAVKFRNQLVDTYIKINRKLLPL
jgi:hypothetical protein